MKGSIERGNVLHSPVRKSCRHSVTAGGNAEFGCHLYLPVHMLIMGVVSVAHPAQILRQAACNCARVDCSGWSWLQFARMVKVEGQE